MSKPHEVLIRPIQPRDLDDLTRIFMAMYDERDAGSPIHTTLRHDRPPESEITGYFRELIHRSQIGEAAVVAADMDGHAVGFCNIARAGPPALSEVSHVGELGILVHRDHRGVGIGTALLEESLAKARSKFELVYLSVWSNNEAVRLYRRFGFSVCGHLPRMVKRGNDYVDEERMVLDFSKTPAGPGAKG